MPEKRSTEPPPEVPYGPPVDRRVKARSGINTKDALKVGARIAAPFVIGAIFRAVAKR